MFSKTILFTACLKCSACHLNFLRSAPKASFKVWSCIRHPIVPFKLTDIGEGIKEVTIKQCHVKPQQKVAQFEDVCDVESDKATVTITSRFDGYVKTVHFKEGDIIAVGSTLLDIEIDEESVAESVGGGVTAADVVVPATPALNEDVVEKKKITAYPASSGCGHVDGETKSVDYAGLEAQTENGNGGRENATLAERLEWREKALATPAVRRIAKDFRLDINLIKGTGKQRRVTKEDILKYLNQPRADTPTYNQYQSPLLSQIAAATAAKTDNTVSSRSDNSAAASSDNSSSSSGSRSERSFTCQPITAYRKVMFKTMTESNKIPTLTLSEEIDVTSVETLRTSLKKQSSSSSIEKDDEIKPTLLAFVIKAISLSLRQFPVLNSTLEFETIKFMDAHNIGVAVDTPAGLAVPNIKNTQLLSVRQIAVEVRRLQRLATDGKLSLADTAAGTFTVSNIGSIAGTVVKPLILPPQVAIVGIGRIRYLPRFDDDDVVRKCSLINASWAADHRVVDGATVARFSNSVKRYLENPALMAVDA